MKDQVILATMGLEGGFSPASNLADHGGITNFGITKPFLSDDIGREATDADIKALTAESAYDVYARFRDREHFDKIPNDTVRGEVFDAAVNHGASRGVKLLQEALGVAQDGKLGPATLAGVPYLDGTKLALRVIAARLRWFGRIITDNMTDADHDGAPDNAEMAKGWMARMATRIERLA